jgi:hypothetical protein
MGCRRWPSRCPAAVGLARTQFVGDDLERKQALHPRHQLHVVERLGQTLFRARL